MYPIRGVHHLTYLQEQVSGARGEGSPVTSLIPEPQTGAGWGRFRRRRSGEKVAARQLTAATEIKVQVGKIHGAPGDWLIQEGTLQFILADTTFRGKFEPLYEPALDGTSRH